MARTDDQHKAHVGEQLRDRRIALNLSQAGLTALVGGDRRSVTAAENGETVIQIRKRAAWEESLRLKPGAISRAYRDGGPLETLDEATDDPPPADADELTAKLRRAEGLLQEAAEILEDLRAERREPSEEREERERRGA